MATRSEEVISIPSDGERTRNNVQQSYRCLSTRSPCFWWSRFCSWFLSVLQRLFGCFGERIAKSPLITILICLMFVSFCSVGFAWFKTKNRTVELFIPQRSRSIEDLDKAAKYFRVKIREEIVLLVASPDDRNVLAPHCLRQAFKAHRAVMELESYTDFCVTLPGRKAKTLDDCMIINPLEFLQFNETKLDGKTIEQVQEEITKAYNSPNPLTRNGRTFSYNFQRTFGGPTSIDGAITKATALQMVYLMSDFSDEKENEKVLEWEKKFIDKLKSLESNFSCFNVHFSSERSLDDAIAESSGSDVTLVSITFTLMISFACVMLGKFLNPLTGHSLLANTGVFAVALGILSGFGLAMWCRVPFVSIVGVLPFLVLGIGIDDMFILVDELDRQPRDMSVPDVIKAVMVHSGATVTMTTVTDLVAFAVSTSTSFPAIRYFCIYAALTVTFSYIMIITYFVAVMTYDVKRIKSGRRDCLPFCRAPSPKEGAPAWDDPTPQLSNRAMETWGRFLTHSATKVVVIILSLGLFGAGIYGVTRVDENFDRRILAKDNSYLKRFLTAEAEQFELSIEVSIVETGNVNYEKSSTQEAIKNLTNIVNNNKHYLARSLSWMDQFAKFAKMGKINTSGEAFLPELKAFLRKREFSYFTQDLKFSPNGSAIEASRIICFMKSNGESIFQKNAMQTLREDLEKKSKLGAFPITRVFIFFEQYVIISRETIRNLMIAAITVFAVTSLFLIDCTVAILVLFNFAALICELFGLMVIWDVSLNAVSMINLVMAIGFAVDYSAHIAHAFVVSNKLSVNERVVEALSTVGASVLLGGFSTFLGMIVLAFAASEIFRIFFRMFLGIVGFGLIHGLCILPVYMSLLCWRPVVRVSADRLNSSSQKEECGQELHHAEIGSENGDPAASYPSLQLAEEENINKEVQYGNTKQEDGRNHGQRDRSGQDLHLAEIDGENRDLAADNPTFQLTEEEKVNEEVHNGNNEHEDGRNQKDKCGQDLLPAEIGGENRDLAADNPSFQLTEDEKVNKEVHNGSKEQEDGRNQKDKCGQDLLPAEIGDENQDLAADNPSFQLTGEDEEDNVDKEAHNSKEKQEDGGTDDDQYVVNPFKGIHNAGLETGDEELHSSTREGSKQQSLSEKQESEDNEGNSEAIQAPDKSDTLVEVAKL